MIQTELNRYDQTYRADHYVFHYLADSKAAQDIARIAEHQERWYERITDILGVTRAKPIQYYLTNSPLDAGRIAGDDVPCNAFAWGPDTVVATYSEDLICIGPHEDTHILSWQLANPASVFIFEGLAMHIGGTWWGEPNETWAKRFFADGSIQAVEALLDNETFFTLTSAVTYPVAGAFTSFLADRFGMAAYLRDIYCTTETIAEALERAFGCAMSEIESAFSDWLDQVRAKTSNLDIVY